MDTPIEELTAELKTEFLDLAVQLSPENLTCDGECSAEEVRKRRASLLHRWDALQRRAGRAVTEHEVWDAAEAPA